LSTSNKKKIVLPIVAAIALVLLLWLAFHDRSVAATLAMATCAPRSTG
jgi:hypothetical protein